ncbi:MAG: hypothetical protein K0R57_6030 [Paenibacillaceae bacterium]|jgi:dienelactone hydrolase|nr:hypothetical protein [Paenibacillaceae bacterium]
MISNNHGPQPFPLVLRAPKHRHQGGRDLVIWLSGFTGTKERMIPQLEALADLGFHAVSFDLFGHGERLRPGETMQEMAARVRSNRREHFWRMLGHTAGDMRLVIDWAVERLHIDGLIIAGGVSAGGDISIAAAGMDRRIQAVSACIATPDWLRQGSSELQGTSDAVSQQLFNRFNPVTHPESFAHMPWLHFENAGQDRLVPPEAAVRFSGVLRQSCYRSCPERISITEHPGVGHGFTDAMWQGSLEWIKSLR